MTTEAEQSNIVLLFGDNPIIRIIDALVDNIGNDYSKKDIQEISGISKSTLFKHWDAIEHMGLVTPTRSFGRTRLYTLNKNNKIVKDILKLEMDMIEKTTPMVIKSKAR